MAEVASAFVSLMPSAKGFGSKLDSQIGGEIEASGKKSGGKFGTALKVGAVAAVGGAALGVAAFTKTAIGLEASFSKTMNVLQATTGASGESMKKLSALAIKMGADTAFSASDASQAMLELARGGITPAQIQAGALQGTLTLAAAGELDMGEAANTAVKAMGAFNLQGKDMGTIAAALAGGANASSASVRDMSQALAQGGLAAHSAGFSIQETTATLAAFSNAGLEGADAGTSLKTFLNNLQPATEGAATAFEQLGIFSSKTGSKFVKANGEFKSAAQIAELLKKGTEGLSAAERTRALTTAFGTDAQRAATIMATQGAAGLNKLIKATSDTSAAQKMGAANMKGTAGAIEQLKGSVETLTLQFGLLIAPAVQGGLKLLTAGINGIAPAISKISSLFSSAGGAGGAGGFATTVKTLGATLKANFLPVLQQLAAFFTTAVLPAVIRLSAYLRANLVPIFQQVAGVVTSQVVPIIGALARFLYGTLIPAVFKITVAVGERLKPVFDELFKQIQTSVLPTLKQLLAKFREYQPTLQKVALVVLKVVGVALKLAASILGTVLPVVIRFAGFMIRNTVGALIAVVGATIKVIAFLVKVGGAFVRAISFAVRFQTGVVRAVGEAVRFVGSVPGKILSALGNLGHLLYNAGKAVIQGLLDGIGKMVKPLTDKLHQITSLIPKHKGPIDKDRKLLKPAGQAIMEGLIKGLESRERALKDKLASITSKIADLKSAAKDFASSVAQNFTTDAFGGNLEALKTTLATDTANARAFGAALKTAIGKGLNGDLLKQLATSGNLGLAQEIAGSSRADIAALEKSLADRAQAAAVDGRLVADREWTKSINEQTRELKSINDLLAANLHKQHQIHVHDKSGDPKKTAKETSRRLAFAGGS